MEQTIPRPEFPRPDFVRNEWETLNGTWELSFEEPVLTGRSRCRSVISPV